MPLGHGLGLRQGLGMSGTCFQEQLHLGPFILQGLWLRKDYDALARRVPPEPTHLLGAVASIPYDEQFLAGQPGLFPYLRRELVDGDSLSIVLGVPYNEGDLRSPPAYPPHLSKGQIHVQEVAFEHFRNARVFCLSSNPRHCPDKGKRLLIAVHVWPLWPRLGMRVEALIAKLPGSFPVEKSEHELNTEHPRVVVPVGVRRRSDDRRIRWAHIWQPSCVSESNPPQGAPRKARRP